MKPLPLATRALLARLPARYDREQCELMAHLALWRYAGPDTSEALTLRPYGRPYGRIARCAIVSELRAQDGGRSTSSRAAGRRATQSYDVSEAARTWCAETIRDPGAEFQPAVHARVLLAGLLPRLTARQREALYLVDWQGLTYAASGQELGIDSSTVFSARLTALRNLRRWCEVGEYAAREEAE